MTTRFTPSLLLRIGLAVVVGALLGDVVSRLIGERWWWLPWVLLTAFWLFVLYRRRRSRSEPTATHPGGGDGAT